MANKVFDDVYIKDIADAIREKNGATDEYKVYEMGAAIRAIEGDGNTTPTKPEEVKPATIKTNGIHDIFPTDGYTMSQVIVDVQVPTDSATLVASGSCGANATWEFHNDGRFIVKGTGETYGYNSPSDRPWNEYCAQITSLDIEEGITTIGFNMFTRFNQIENVVIPNGVTEIKGSAFELCSALKYITIPNSVTSIDQAVFYEVNNLIYILYSGTRAEWDSITKGSLNTVLKNDSKLCCNYNTTRLIDEITQNGLAQFTPENGQLYNQVFLNVNVPQITTTEFNQSFSDNGSFTYDAEDGQAFNKVTININVPTEGTNNSFLIDSGSCGENATWKFFANGTLVINGQGAADFDIIGDHNNTSGLSDQVIKIIVNNGISSIMNAFFDVQNLESIVLPNTLDTIVNYTFSTANKLKVVYYEGTESEWNSITIGTGNDALFSATLYYEYKESIGLSDTILFSFIDGSITNFIIPNTFTTIRNGLFYGCENLTNILIPDSVTYIGRSAFYLCSSLKKITLPNSITRIDTYAFGQCTSIKEYDFTSWTDIPTLSNVNAFSGIASDCVMKVPAALYNQLITTTNWSEFADYMVSV